MPATDYTYIDKPNPHHERTRKILKAYPKARELIGHNPWTLALTLLVVAIQWTLAYFLRDAAWWAILLVAYTIGAFAAHALFVVIHEAGHDLIFKKSWGNRLTGILADTGHLIPSSVSFGLYHHKHHAYFSTYEGDADLAYQWEARLIGSSFVRKALWLLFFPVVEGVRSFRIKNMNFFTGWTIVNWIIVFSIDIALFMFLGPKALLYMLFSLIFGIGLHPLGARWIQEHYLFAAPQETYSYYGLVNLINMNIGYHNEHHDIPSIPWNRLPKLKKMAPEFYDSLHYHPSYTRVLWRFLTDKEITLFSRIVRPSRS